MAKPLKKKQSKKERLEKKREAEVTLPENKKAQEADTGFFEKFDAILKQASQRAVLEECTPLAPLKEAEEKDGELKVEADLQAENSSIRDSDSGNGALIDTDSEPDEHEKDIDRYIEAFGWDIDELYLEILYEILHNVEGCDVESEVGQLPLLSYVQEAFRISNDKHKKLMTKAGAKEPPELMLDVEVVVDPEDPNGLSYPFVVTYMMSNSSQKRTSLKQTAFNPVSHAHFSIPILGNFRQDSLCIEVWDSDTAETAKGKLKKIVKNLGKLVKESTKTASTGKHDKELIGIVNISLKCINAIGKEIPYSLRKKSKLRQGVVKVRLNFSLEKNKQVAAQEHRHLLRILLLHDLENSKVAPFWWSGNFTAQAQTIITLHGTQNGLSKQDISLVQWFVYCAVTTDHPLSFALFNTLLDKISDPVKSGLINEEDVKLFWDATKKLLPTCFSHIRELKKKTDDDKPVMGNRREVLKILNKLSVLDVPDSIDLFPENLYGWLRYNKEGDRLTIHDVLQQAVIQGASDWFVHILEHNYYILEDKSEESTLQHLIKVIQLVHSDIEKAVEYYDPNFVDALNFPYPKALYGLYEKKIAYIVEPTVLEVCKRLKRLRHSERPTNSVHLAGGINGDTGIGTPMVENEALAMGTALFELYLTLQGFSTLGQALNETEWSTYAISNFHTWFLCGVAQWLDIAAFKARSKIKKAVDIDTLTQVDTNVKHGSSGVDTFGIFYQIKTSWTQLAWPDVVGCYKFFARIVNDICRCCVFYSDKMAARVDSVGTVNTVFEVTTEWCVAINNIDYVKQIMKPFVVELGIDDIMQRLSEEISPVEAQMRKETMLNEIANAIDTVQKKIEDLLLVMVRKMMTSITRFLYEGAESLHRDCSECSCLNSVMRYLEENLTILHQHLGNEIFSRTLDILWEQLGKVFYELIQVNLEKRRPPSFFSKFDECIKLMIHLFRIDNGKEGYTSDTLKKIDYLLKFHGMETREWIHQYHLERWQEQQAIVEPKMGILTVRAQFKDDNLKVEILNAQNLMPTDSNGYCDSYVRVRILPEDTFANVVKPKTQTRRQTLFPLYGDEFMISLTHEQRNTADGMLHFVIKDKDSFSMSNTFVGEAYLHFNEIPDTPAHITSLPQRMLTLSRPASFDGDAIKALETRQGDKQARVFLKKQRQKMPSKQCCSVV